MKKELLIAGLLAVALLAGGGLLIQNVPDHASWPILLGAVILEVVLAPIPGGAVAFITAEQLGYWAWPVLYAGNMIGATIVFWLVNRFGRPYVERMASEKDLRRYDRVLNGHPFWLALLYAVPFVPIDVLTLGAGASRMSWQRFFKVVTLPLVSYAGLQTLIAVQLAQFTNVLTVLYVVAAAVVFGVLVWAAFELFS